jgi:hypothetical protein
MPSWQVTCAYAECLLQLVLVNRFTQPSRCVQSIQFIAHCTLLLRVYTGVQEAVKAEEATAGTEKAKPVFLDEANKDRDDDLLMQEGAAEGDDAWGSDNEDRDAEGYPTGRVPEDKKARHSILQFVL